MFDGMSYLFANTTTLLSLLGLSPREEQIKVIIKKKPVVQEDEPGLAVSEMLEMEYMSNCLHGPAYYDYRQK